MKKTTILSMAALLLGSSALFAQSAYTKPAGFVKHTLKAGQFNLIGLTLHEPVNVTGTFTAVAANNNGTTGDATDDYSVLTDTSVNFQTALTANKTYILEITSGDLAGTIQEVKTWNVGNNVNTIKAENDIVSGTGVKVGDKFQMRASVTISDIFGADNSAGLLATNQFKAAEADVIYVPNGSGFDRYFYSNLTGVTGWKKAADFTDAGDIPLPYVDAIMILRRADSDLDIIFTGTVKTTSTTLALGAGSFNYITTVYPVGMTLGNSGLEANLTPTDEFKAAEADLVYMPNDTNGYDRYFYSNLAGVTGWKKASDFTDAANVPMKSGVIILRRGEATGISVATPATYSKL